MWRLDIAYVSKDLICGYMRRNCKYPTLKVYDVIIYSKSIDIKPSETALVLEINGIVHESRSLNFPCSRRDNFGKIVGHLRLFWMGTVNAEWG